eukprot:2924804-Rhodomonas_salina.1
MQTRLDKLLRVWVASELLSFASAPQQCISAPSAECRITPDGLVGPLPLSLPKLRGRGRGWKQSRQRDGGQRGRQREERQTRRERGAKGDSEEGWKRENA